MFALKKLVGIICMYHYKFLDLQYFAIQKHVLLCHLFMFYLLNNTNT